ncbi:MAG TPA: sterol desaturase family protein [Kofleriaceae bacterium]|nr:sterol desaturase family protein [Kofleriaceae bacterium]
MNDGSKIRTRKEALRVFFSRKGPRTIAKIAAGTWIARLVLGPPGLSDLAAAAAAIGIWPVQEWVLHKYVLHLEPRKIAGKHFDPMFAQAHRTHHADPRDVDMTLLPQQVIVTAAPVAAAGWLMAFGFRRAALTGMATYSTMTLFYEWTHFIVHTNVKPLTSYGKLVRRNHRLHHYRHENYWFGFTFPLIDRWLGTAPDPDTITRSPTAMDLYGLDAQRAESA